jgi:hypothetical protein
MRKPIFVDGIDVDMHSVTQRFFGRWVLATFGGWVLGVVLVLLLAAIGEGAHVGNQFAVGIGMGLGVGYAQWRVARKWFGATTQWIWASAVGMGTPFVLLDVLGIWRDKGWFVFVIAVLGGLLSSVWQRRMLQSRSVKANWWVPACILGWGVAAALPPALLLPGPHVSNIGVIASGGIALGVVTGGTLVWALQPHPKGVS